jgi:hypothetical protein
MDDLVAALKELGNSFQRAKSALVDSQKELANTNNMLAASLGR